MRTGLVVSAEEVHVATGNLARDANALFLRTAELRRWLAGQTAADIGGGMTQEEFNLILAAVDDLAQLGRIYRGEIALQAMKDFRQNLRRLAGLGFQNIS